MKTYVFVFLSAIIVCIRGDNLVDTFNPKFKAKEYAVSQANGYQSSYSHPTGSNRQKLQQYMGLSDYGDHNVKFNGEMQSFGNIDQQKQWTTAEVKWDSTGWNRTHSAYSNGHTQSSYYQDPIETSQSMHEYQHVRSPMHTGHVMYKKPMRYYGKRKFVKTLDTRTRQKKPHVLYYMNPTLYKKNVYPRIRTIYTMHKYPVKKTIHPYYRRHYQVPYAMQSFDVLRSKMKNIYAYRNENSVSSTTPTTTSNDYNTDETTSYASTTFDLQNNNTYPNRTFDYSNYYDSYGELDQVTEEPSSSSYHEPNIRGYYGDRVYMSMHTPPFGSKKGLKHRLHIGRNVPEDDEDQLDTIFD